MKMRKKANFQTILNIDENTERISMREYLRNSAKYNRLVKNGRVFVVTNQNQDEIVLSKADTKKEKKYTMEDILNFRFRGPTDLSENIDEIVYGIKRDNNR
jgi:hypothetical protein